MTIARKTKNIISTTLILTVVTGVAIFSIFAFGIPTVFNHYKR